MSKAKLGVELTENYARLRVWAAHLRDNRRGWVADTGQMLARVLDIWHDQRSKATEDTVALLVGRLALAGHVVGKG